MTAARWRSRCFAQEIGDADFREVLESWAQENEFGNASTQDLYDQIEDVTGEERPDAFDDWLYEDGKPSCSFCRERITTPQTPTRAKAPPGARRTVSGAPRRASGP